MALDSPNAAFLRERPVVPLPPLLSPSACIFSHHGEGSSLTSLISTLRYIRNNAAKTAPVRRWLDEDYDYDAPEEVARRNQVFEAFARRVAAIESAEAGIGLQSHIEEDTEYADGTRETIGMQLCDVGRKATGRKLCVKKPVSLATTTSRRPSHSQTKTSDSSPRHLKETSDLQAREKRVPDDQTETVPTAIRAGEHPLSKFQVQEFEMVRAYLAKRAAHFEWVSTSSHGLEPLPYPNDIPLSNDIIAYRFELAVNHVCNLLSMESPFEAKPTVLKDADSSVTDAQNGSPCKGEKGRICTPLRRFGGSAATILLKSRATLNHHRQMDGVDPVFVGRPANA